MKQMLIKRVATDAERTAGININDLINGELK